MTKYSMHFASKFKKDLKKFQHDKKLLAETNAIIKRLANDELLEPKYRDHALTGNMKGLRECHIRGDVLLIYRKEENVLIMTCARIGTHSETLGL